MDLVTQAVARNWSAQQLAIFEWLGSGEGNLVVRARAGCGKTTTIVEALKHARESSVLLCAFNKRIAKELTTKVQATGGSAEVKTLHGVGYGIVQRYWERCQLDARRGYDLAKQAAGDQAPDDMIAKIQKLAGTAKGMIAFFDRNDPELLDTMIDLAERFNLEPDDQWAADGWTTEKVAQIAIEAMHLATLRGDTDRAPRIDFDDMLFLPLANNWARPRYDLVAVDEAQDMNAAQIELARRVLREGGRMVVIGDDKQAIYGFRGADSGALDRLKSELHAKELGLTTTYRCGRAIVASAAKLVPDFTAGPNNPDGTIESLHESRLVETAQPGDFVLSRKNAPLVAICLRAIRAGKAARIEGKDVAAGLRSIVKRWKPKNVQQLVDRIETWKENEAAKLVKKKAADLDAKLEEVNDKAEILLALTDGLADPAEIFVRLDRLFGDNEDNPPPQIVCSSIHKAKGLEARRVFILKATLYPQRKKFMRDGYSEAEALRMAQNEEEERNLDYVAQTRAIDTLVWVVA